MAITTSFAKYLLYDKKNGVDFSKILTLGRLRLYSEKSKLERIAKELQVAIDFSTMQKQDYAEDFFRIIGVNQLDSIDYSDYEKATIIHDLNLPIPESLYRKYSVVLDSGTLEHVFNFPTAIKNCMEVLAVGGTYIGITPANNMMGHGFYQFSPELYYRIFSEENGFRIKNMFIGVLDSKGEVEKWYAVKDPVSVQTRVTLRNFKETFLFVTAEKMAELPVLLNNPCQSDYVTAWEKAKTTAEISFSKKLYKQFVPEILQVPIRKIKNYFFNVKKLRDESIGFIDTSHFIETEL
jgi:hypothetical protein